MKKNERTFKQVDEQYYQSILGIQSSLSFLIQSLSVLMKAVEEKQIVNNFSSAELLGARHQLIICLNSIAEIQKYLLKKARFHFKIAGSFQNNEEGMDIETLYSLDRQIQKLLSKPSTYEIWNEYILDENQTLVGSMNVFHSKSYFRINREFGHHGALWINPTCKPLIKSMLKVK